MSSLLLVPGQSLLLVGVEVLVVGIVIWTLATWLDVSILLKTELQYRRSFMLNMGLSQLAVLPYVIAGITVLVGGAAGLY